MSDYTPTTEQIRAAWIQKRWDHLKMLRGDSIEEFDRWLALIIEGAEQRGAVKAGRAMLEQAILDMDTEFGAHL